MNLESAGRITARRAQMKALIGQTDSNERQAQALERIAAALEFLCDHIYPAPAGSVIVDSAGEPATAEVDYEPGKASEV